MEPVMMERLAAEMGIRNLQARYVYAVWRWDMEAFSNCFTEDAEWRVVGNVVHGRDACVALLAQLRDNFDRVLFLMQSPMLEIGDGAASGRTYCTEQNVYKDRRPGFSIGIYYDRFRLERGIWRYSYHHFQSLYLGPADMTGRFFDFKDYGSPPNMPGPKDPATPSAETIFGNA